MELLNAVVSAAVIAVVGLLLSLQLRGEGRNLRRELDQVRGELGDVRADLRQFRSEVRADQRDVRADLTRIAMALGAGPATGTERR